MKNRLLFVVDYRLDEPSSLSEMLKALYFDKHFATYDKFLFLKPNGISLNIKNIIVNDITYYRVQENIRQEFKKTKSFSKKMCLLTLFLRRKVYGFFGREESAILRNNGVIVSFVARQFRINCILFISFIPSLLPRKFKTSRFFILYDPFSGRPGSNKKRMRDEKKIIASSDNYYVADYFYNEYVKMFGKNHIKQYKLPFFVPSKNIENYSNSLISNNEFTFSYFGQISERLNDKLVSFLTKNHIIVDSFTTYIKVPFANTSCLRNHEPVVGQELYKAIANSRFLICFDNNKSFSSFFSSKLLLYVSFKKPVILFTDNANSSNIEFVRNYPFGCVINYNTTEASNKLFEFIEKSNSFDYESFDSDKKYGSYSSTYFADMVCLDLNRLINKESKHNG